MAGGSGGEGVAEGHPGQPRLGLLAEGEAGGEARGEAGGEAGGGGQRPAEGGLLGEGRAEERRVVGQVGGHGAGRPAGRRVLGLPPPAPVG